VQRQRCLKLPQDLVAHRLVVLAVGRARRACRETAPLDDGKALFGSAPPRDPELRSAKERRLIRMLAGPQKHALLVGVEARRQWRKRVGLGRYRGREQAHTGSSWATIATIPAAACFVSPMCTEILSGSSRRCFGWRRPQSLRWIHIAISE